MKIVRILEYKVWIHKPTGRTASITGAIPDSNMTDWELQTRGWTHELDNGTRGLGRPPCKTYKDAVEVMNRFNNRK